MKIRNPKKNTLFHMFNGHLALFHQTSDHKEYWKEYWEDGYFSRLVKDAEQGKMGEFENYAFKYLKPSDVILEAGCGPAHIVLGLQRKGFNNVIGIDYEEHVVEEVNKRLPILNVKKGDILSLDMPDNYLDAYLSFGVVEHFVNGPEPALREAARVLKNGGTAMISVPYLNPLRRAMMKKASPVAGNIDDTGKHFHQYYFSKEEFSDILQRSGLTVVDTYPYSSFAFLTREHTYFSKLWRSRLGRKSIRDYLKRYFYHAGRSFRNRYGHMCMFICKAEKYSK